MSLFQVEGMRKFPLDVSSLYSRTGLILRSLLTETDVHHLTKRSKVHLRVRHETYDTTTLIPSEVKIVGAL